MRFWLLSFCRLFFDVKEEKVAEFEPTFQEAGKIISSMKGYIYHELKKCMETKNRYILLVNWETLEDHTVGFRESDEYQEWKALLHHFYDPFLRSSIIRVFIDWIMATTLNFKNIYTPELNNYPLFRRNHVKNIQ